MRYTPRSITRPIRKPSQRKCEMATLLTGFGCQVSASQATASLQRHQRQPPVTPKLAAVAEAGISWPNTTPQLEKPALVASWRVLAGRLCDDSGRCGPHWIGMSFRRRAVVGNLAAPHARVVVCGLRSSHLRSVRNALLHARSCPLLQRCIAGVAWPFSCIEILHQLQMRSSRRPTPSKPTRVGASKSTTSTLMVMTQSTC